MLANGGLSLFGLMLLAKAYNPDQPRVPAGDPDGGQWTDGGVHLLRPRHDPGRRDEGEHVRVAGERGGDDQRYSVNLAEEESPRGIGHTIRRHVARSDEDLLAEVRQIRFAPPAGRIVLGFRVGSFASMESANDFVNRTLESNRDQIDEFIAGGDDDLTVWRRFGFITGREAVRNVDDPPPYARNTYGVKVVLVRTPKTSRGYRILTAFPANE